MLMDAKRGDIGSTMAGYAAAYLDPSSPLASDALTVNPYLGFGSLQPAFDAAAAAGAGLFVIALTSNPEAPQFQSARTDAGPTVAGAVLAGLKELNAGADGLGSYGAVVGATIGGTSEDLAINGPLLAPGLGAQGATADPPGPGIRPGGARRRTGDVAGDPCRRPRPGRAAGGDAARGGRVPSGAGLLITPAARRQ